VAIAKKIRGGDVLVTAATTEPVTLAEAKLHLRVDVDDDDDVINRLIRTARHQTEVFTGRRWVNSTYRLRLDRFPFVGEATQYNDVDGSIILPHGPLSSVSSITYVDTDGNTATATTADYTVDTDSVPGRVALAFGKSWPDAREQANAVSVTYVAGYGTTATSVPDAAKSAIHLLVGHWYNNREEVSATIGGNVVRIPVAAETLLWGLRVMRFS
jgi:uncharacterized phiE125 gp8 family phage protein